MEYAKALSRLFVLANERWPAHTRGPAQVAGLPRLYFAAKLHAERVVKVATSDAAGYSALSAVETDSKMPVAAYRSLAAADESDADEAVPERFAATSMADAPSPLSRDDVPDGLVEQARAVLAPGSSDKRPRH